MIPAWHRLGGTCGQGAKLSTGKFQGLHRTTLSRLAMIHNLHDDRLCHNVTVSVLKAVDLKVASWGCSVPSARSLVVPG
eukprot:607621-Hanusia_phi.AAC.2